MNSIGIWYNILTALRMRELCRPARFAH